MRRSGLFKTVQKRVAHETHRAEKARNIDTSPRTAVSPHPLTLCRIHPNRLPSLHLDGYLAALDCGNDLRGGDECCAVRLLRQDSRYFGEFLLQVG